MKISDYFRKEFKLLKSYYNEWGNDKNNTMAMMKETKINGAIELATKFGLITLEEIITIREEVMSEV